MVMRLILVALVLAGLFGGIFGWKQHTAQQMAAAQAAGLPPPVIAATTVRRESWQPYIQVVGSLVAIAGIEVTSEVSGQVSAIHVSSGEPVDQGDLLVELDDKTDQAQLKGLLAERALARLKYERLAALIRDKSVSKSDYDEARVMLDAADAAVTAQQALVEKKRIRAPFDGRLGIRRIDVGEYLTPGAAIVPLEKLDPIFADFSLPERELARIKVAQTVEIKVQAYPEARFSGQIRAIDPGVNIGSRSFRVRAELENPGQQLRPGMFADVRVLLPQQQDVVTVPDTAISYAPYGDSVFVIEDKDGQSVVTRRQIETGPTRDGRVSVSSGLEVGEKVVSAGHNKLRNGQAVAIDSRPAPAEREASPGPSA
ncbi:MAG: efflux RND transporter periplasmic adaptor subunit [Chromatiaceae bacterium]|nr:efflux RND transporter periplasmic adaptor subunit [Gammaproteobacteria bacterium]MCP5317259.1 efflux RND transporter periplasmic adaptor subunit [Chromatiaceae bacterium]MCW5586123.1 efflux RND transporter periplasmic adaptor subunit [Chromatiales bacterium]MCP5430804.1 efflux RND transporter periplasmic adaptor subunit [Chromatiaceae bacterium]HOP17067.1 efflux RND transporter periplasmic adaptor subunit [Gammaproteobacteria bacterium]